MKLMIVGWVISTLFSCAAKVDDGVREIRQEFWHVQSSISTLQKTQRILFGISTEGAAVTAYRENGVIRKIVVEALGETGKYLADFYFENKRLIFSHIRLIDYGGHIMEAREEKHLRDEIVEEDRFYFADGKLIKWMRFEEQTLPYKPGYEEKGQSVLGEAKSFMLLMETPPPKEGEEFCDWICDRKEDERCVEYRCE